MIILLFFIGGIYAIGLSLGVAIVAMVAVGALALIALQFTIRFWWLIPIALLIMILPILYLEGVLSWFLGMFIALILFALFLPAEKDIQISEKEEPPFWLPKKSTINIINPCVWIFGALFFRYVANIQDWLLIIFLSAFLTFIIDIILYSKRPSLFSEK